MGFNSRFVQPGAEAVDTFTRDWSPENNWLVSPISLIGRVLKHTSDCKAVGTPVVPLWKSAYFWPLSSSDATHLNYFVCQRLYLPNRPDLFGKGKVKNKLFGTKAFKSRCFALRIDFARLALLMSAFALLRWAPVQLAILRRSVEVCLFCF